MRKANRIGEININKFDSLMEIVEYTNNDNIVVRFKDNGNLVKSTYDSFKRGVTRSPYNRTVYGMGFFGEGIHKHGENRRMTHKYKTWHGMMRRCYDQKSKEKQPTYKDCRVSEEWLNYQNFGDWYDQNYYEIEGEQMHLDKDILTKGNKIYSPETCIFVPHYINSLFASCETTHGRYLTCVYENKGKVNKFTARTRTKHLGNFKTKEDAFNAYKEYKESVIVEVANKYKEKIPNKLYKAMMEYKIEVKKD